MPLFERLFRKIVSEPGREAALELMLAIRKCLPIAINAGHAVGRVKIVPGDAEDVFCGDLFKTFDVFRKPAVISETMRVAEPECLVGDVFTAVGKQGMGLF